MMASSALQPCKRDRDNRGVAAPKEWIDPAAPKDQVAALATVTATKCSEGGRRTQLAHGNLVCMSGLVALEGPP